VIIEAVKGDITQQPDMGAIVNAANAKLMPGGGVAGAIHWAAGPDLEKECQPLAPVNPGEAVITKGYRLPNPYVIHCLGPVYGRDKPEDKLLSNCYLAALKIAEERGIESVAFPALSTGAFGYPFEKATEIALDTILSRIPALKSVKRIRFVLFSDRDLQYYERALERRRSKIIKAVTEPVLKAGQ